MLAGAKKSLVWLSAAAYLLGGLLSGTAHFHGHSHAAHEHLSAAGHDHHASGCKHAHGHSAQYAAPIDGQLPLAPHDEEDCAACRFESLAASPVAFAAVPAAREPLPFVERRAPFRLVAKIPSLHRARAPPRAA